MLNRFIKRLEDWFFGHRALTLGSLALFTVLMACFALQLRMEAGFEKQIPIGHPYVEMFQKYRGDLFGANRLTVVVRAKHGSIWNKEGFSRLYDVTQAVAALPNVDRSGVQSLWTPNSFVNEITEDGFRAQPVIPATVIPASITPLDVEAIHRAAAEGGFIGSLVSRGQAAAMITAEVNEVGPDGKKVDYISYNRLLEQKLRSAFEDKDYSIEIIGFAKQIGDIADGARGVLVFCAIALLLTACAVYWYSHSVRFTVLPIVCSLTSLVWQFGTLRILGFGLDPLAVLVPFLVFAIGVSHGVQQINYIVRELSHGKSSMEAARSSFTGLLIPGSLALVTAFVSFITLTLIPIPMIRELAIAASLGVVYKIVTNLVMLPVAASCFTFSKEYATKAMKKRESRAGWLRVIAKIAKPRNAVPVLVIVGIVFCAAVWESRDRVVGTLQPGAPELRPDARFNRDAVDISKSFDVGLDWLSIAIEAPPESCNSPAVGQFVDNLAYHMQSVPGVISIGSYASMLRTYNEGYNEGYPKMNVVPLDAGNYSSLSAEINRVRGYMTKDCSMTALHLYLSDHKATTINRVISAANSFQASHALKDVHIRLAAGNAGLLAATNEELEKTELPMMLYVYGAIVALVFLVYRDLRAVVACCLPLTVGTFIGYWFMKEFQIGLTVATLPVMVLAVGIGVDYAFYIYNRLQLHLAGGEPIVKALEHSMMEVGMATIFTAITLAIGVATWSFSELKFQADMGKLLSFMFLVNLIMAMTALPALAVVLDIIFPRRRPVRAPGVLGH
ncbi:MULTISPECIES: efflux RND transporter permease subunit [Paraburkholderia]|uniref:efflux RND transporter permease subunit n=1 Tax=Paraburkholderia TaxID=1822464 RepID=UPI00225C101A|nr:MULTISPECIES: MMPL family transporter [Paraburkholderia]MCX4176983.1 MMPL family transporter [Paraburkholderia madseniana]MDQ6464973.1 MMPL family transporter [Paraburkholderia madseniana]